MGFKMKFKAPKISVPKTGIKGVDRALKDATKVAEGIPKSYAKLVTGDLGGYANELNKSATAFAQMTNLVKRPGDLPDVAGQMPTTGTEPPSLSAVTEDQNDLQRKELGRRFASRQLFGGMSGMSSMGRSSSLLGF